MMRSWLYKNSKQRSGSNVESEVFLWQASRMITTSRQRHLTGSKTIQQMSSDLRYNNFRNQQQREDYSCWILRERNWLALKKTFFGIYFGTNHDIYHLLDIIRHTCMYSIFTERSLALLHQSIYAKQYSIGNGQNKKVLSENETGVLVYRSHS